MPTETLQEALPTDSVDILQQLIAVIRARRLQADSANSYVASLHQKGLDKILGKVAEEAMEVGLAAKEYQLNQRTETKEHMVYELADLWFHVLVLMDHIAVDYQDVIKELERRLHKSGLQEKAQRIKNQ